MASDPTPDATPEDPLAAPPPARPRTCWQTYGTDSPIALLVAGVLGVVLLLAVAMFLVPREHGTVWPKTRCANNLRQIGGLYASEHAGSRIPSEGGAPLLVSWIRKGFIQRGRESVLLCPEDPDALAPEKADGSGLYHTADLANAAALATLCSYAVRDFAAFPVNEDGTDPKTGALAWLACDRQGRDGRTPHHEGGLNVLFADGAVQFKDRAFLGLADDEPIIVGPDSPHPELRKMVFLPPR